MANYQLAENVSISRGNSKLGNDTLIFNMGSGTNCPSRKLGHCKLGNKCYALKAERLYPQCLPSRDRQEAYWLGNSIIRIIEDFGRLLTTKKTRVDGKLVKLESAIKWLRFNEAGDFHSQECVEKLDQLSVYLELVHGIRTYGYSARKDLDFSDVNFAVKSSGHFNGNNGRTIAKPKAELLADSMIKAGYEQGHPVAVSIQEDNYKMYTICPMDCKKCDACKTADGVNIVFPLH